MFLGATPEDIHVLKRKLLELKALKLQIILRNFLEGCEEVNRFKKVKLLIVTVKDDGVGRVELELPFIFDELKALALPLSWMKLARSNDLIYLKMDVLSPSISDSMEIADRWANLEEILQRHNKFQTEHFIEFKSKFDRLKKNFH